MFNADVLCSDCHCSMLQVGNYFSKNVSPSNAGAFILAKYFYTNANTPSCLGQRTRLRFLPYG